MLLPFDCPANDPHFGVIPEIFVVEPKDEKGIKWTVLPDNAGMFRRNDGPPRANSSVPCGVDKKIPRVRDKRLFFFCMVGHCRCHHLLTSLWYWVLLFVSQTKMMMVMVETLFRRHVAAADATF